MTDRLNASELRQILKSKPSMALAEIDAWLNAGRIKHSINWLGLAEAASSKAAAAVRQGNREDALGWANVQIRVNELILSAIEPHNVEKYQMSAMMMRLSMMRAYGAVSGNPIFDPKIIEAWALRFPEVSMEQASNYQEYHTLPPKLRMHLGRAYDRLKVLAILYDIIDHEPTPKVRQALALWDKLKQ